MTAYRVHYYIYNYDVWHHFKDFDNFDKADEYAKYLNTVDDIGNVSIEEINTDKLHEQ